MLTKADKATIISRDKKCLKCGALANLTIDHKIPICRGGTDEIRNLQTLCSNCNENKSFFMSLSIFQRMQRWIYVDETIERLRHETKSQTSSAYSIAMDAKKTADKLSSKVASLPTQDLSGLQSKADQALNLVHLQTNRTTDLEARFRLLEKYLKLEYVDEAIEVDRIVKDTIQVKEYRKVKV